jgi:hypothetical protein
MNENNSVSADVDESVWGKTENENFVFSLQPDTKNLFVYSEHRQKVKKSRINFPLLKSEKKFFNGCSWVNTNGKLYISGGITSDGTFSKEFIVYDNIDTTGVTLLHELKERRANHSMFFNDESIYFLGGENTKTTEIYNVNLNTFITKNNKNYESVDNPIVWIHNGYIYSFFGIKNGVYVDYVQRANLKLEDLKWEKVPYKISAEDIDNKIIGCGIIPCGNSEIYFFGGKKENTTTNQSIIFNFDSKEFSNAGVPLEQGQFFKDNKFIELGKKTYGQFSLTEPDNFLKIDVSYA